MSTIMEKRVKDIVKDVKNVALAVCGIAGVIGVVYCVNKVNAMDNLLDGAVKDLSKRTSVTVPDSLVRVATEKAVERAVLSATSEVSANVRSDLDSQIRVAVADSVRNMYGTIKDSVAKELTNKVARLDISDLRSEVKDAAKEVILDRMNLDMDDVLADYNRQLESVGKIYSSIAETMQKKA